MPMIEGHKYSLAKIDRDYRYTKNSSFLSHLYPFAVQLSSCPPY